MAGPSTRVGVLGPLEITGTSGPIALREGRPRKLVASLAMRRGSPVPVDVLIEELWPTQQPGNVRNALQAQVSYVRKMLEPLAPDLALERTADAYVLTMADPSMLDVVVFERAIHAATELTSLDDLEAGLSLWRGTPYADAMYDDFAQREITRLKELHATGRERHAVALLEVGRTAEALELLQQLSIEHPLRESVWAALILAMYRSRRQSDALRVYAAAREHLIEELGVEPGPELRDLERRVLEQDPSLDWTAVDGTPGRSDSNDRPLSRLASRVPVPVSSLIGRSFEVDKIEELVGAHRLVTLLGPGGIGKSRLAIEVANRLKETLPTLVIELGALHPQSDVATLLASEVGVPTQPGSDPLAAVAARLADQPSLLVFDTCEHLLDVVAMAAAKLLRLNPELRILATSRQVLGVSGEVIWSVPPLELADRDVRGQVDAGASDAVRLFVERAAAARPGFVLDDENAVPIARICRSLDGLPLAIELAAARVSLLSPARILERLSDRFALLIHGGRDVEARQQSLRATIEWSYELLNQDEQSFFNRLSAISGSCELDAAVAIAGHGLAEDPFEILSSLVDRSLVRSLEGDRFAMLDTLRSFAAERLAESEDADDRATTDRYARWYVAVALEADPKSHGPLPGHWPRLRADSLNCLATLELLAASGRMAEAAQLAGALAGFWVLDGQIGRADHWLASVRSVEVDDATAASVMRGIGVVEMYQGRFEDSRDACLESVGRARGDGDPTLIASTLLPLGSALWGLGDLQGSITALSEAVELFDQADDRRGQGFALARLGRTMTSMNDAAGVELLERGISLLDESGDGWMMCVALEHLAGALLRRGRTDEAIAVAQRAVDVGRESGSHSGHLFALGTLARGLIADGQLESGLRTSVVALGRAIDTANSGAIADALDAGAVVLAARGEDRLAIELLGMSNQLRDQRRVVVPFSVGDVRSALQSSLTESVGDATFAALERTGRGRTVDWAFELMTSVAEASGQAF